MRKPLVPLFVAATFALGIQGLAAPAPPAPPEKPAEKPAEKIVTVKLKFDPKNPAAPTGIESVTPDPVELSRGRKDFVHWVLSPANAGTLKIKMDDKGGKPFRRHPASRGERDHVFSDAPELGADGSSHKYTVAVRADGQKKDFVLDPIILVRP
jgi:hypothetical protein